MWEPSCGRISKFRRDTTMFQAQLELPWKPPHVDKTATGADLKQASTYQTSTYLSSWIEFLLIQTKYIQIATATATYPRRQNSKWSSLGKEVRTSQFSYTCYTHSVVKYQLCWHEHLDNWSWLGGKQRVGQELAAYDTSLCRKRLRAHK